MSFSEIEDLFGCRPRSAVLQRRCECLRDIVDAVSVIEGSLNTVSNANAGRINAGFIGKVYDQYGVLSNNLPGEEVS